MQDGQRRPKARDGAAQPGKPPALAGDIERQAEKHEGQDTLHVGIGRLAAPGVQQETDEIDNLVHAPLQPVPEERR